MKNTIKIFVLSLVLIACGEGRLSPQGGTITSVQGGNGLTGGGTGGTVTLNVVGATGGGLTVLADSVGLLTSCGSSEILKWNGTAWACSVDTGGITNTAPNNTLMKSDGTNAVASSWTDTGAASSTTSNVTLGDTTADAHTINGRIQFVGDASSRFMYLSDTGTNFGVIYDSGGKMRFGGAATVGGAPAVESFEIDPNTAAATALGTLDVAGNFSVATSKLTVASATGNTTIAGTLTVSDGDAALFSTKKATSTDGLNLCIGGGCQSVAYDGTHAYSGSTNTALGFGSLNALTTGYENTAIGRYALNANTTGFSNTAIGMTAGLAMTTGGYNTCIGAQSCLALTTANDNTVVGQLAYAAQTTGGNGNTIMGVQAMQNSTGVNAKQNVAIGLNAYLNGTAQNNVIVGYSADTVATTANSSVIIGMNAALAHTTGNQNTLIGEQVAQDLTTGGTNTFLGRRTGYGITTGSNNTIIGANVTGLSAALSNNVIIADGAGTVRFWADSSGNTNVGASGTFSVNTSKFTIASATGNTTIAGTLGVSGQLTLPRSAGTPPVLSWKQGGQAEWQLWQHSSEDTFRFWNSVLATDVMSLDTSGNLTTNGSMFELNGAAVLSGTITDNTFPVGSSGNLADSSLAAYGTGGIRATQVTGIAEFTVGDLTSSTGATDVGWNVLTYTDGNIYQDAKLGNLGSVIFRTGHNTEAGSARNWMLVGGNTGNVSFPNSVTLGDAGTDTVSAPGYMGIGVAPDSNVGLKIAKPSGGTYGLYVSTGAVQVIEDLSVNGSTILGDNAASDTTTINGALTQDGAVILNNTTGTTRIGAGTDAAGTSNTALIVENAGATSAVVRNATNDVELFLNTSTVAGQLGTQTSHPLNVKTGDQTRMQLATTGAILIGDTAGSVVSNNVDVLTIGNTGTGITTDSALIKIADSRTETSADRSSTFHIRGIDMALTPTIARDNTIVAGSTGAYGLRISSVMSNTGVCTGSESVCGTINNLVRLDGSGGDYNRVIASGSGDVFIGGSGDLYVSTQSPDNITDSTATKFFVDGATGNTTIKGTLGVSGNATFDGQAQFNAITDFTNVVQNSAGNFTVSDAMDVNGNLTIIGSTNTFGDGSGDTFTFSNGPSGINNYAGTHLEWTDEWMQMAAATGAYVQATGDVSVPFGSIYQQTWIGSGASLVDVTGVTGRPGILAMQTGAGSTAGADISTSTNAVNFGDGNWTWESTVATPTLSTAAQEYQFLVGFLDTTTGINQTDGCWFEYDRAGASTDPGTGDATGTPGDFWQIWCASNNVRTGYILNTTSNGDDSFARVSSAVGAVTYPNTNVYRLKIVMEGSTKAHFWIDVGSGFVEVGRITTNIPTGSSRLTGAGMLIVKSAGTTSRAFHIDQTTLKVDLTAARTP